MSPLYTIHSPPTHDETLSTNTPFLAINPFPHLHQCNLSPPSAVPIPGKLNSTKDIPASNYGRNRILNYASAAANENTSRREQAIVYNTIDGIPQKKICRDDRPYGL
jgi:hypothetical protein